MANSTKQTFNIKNLNTTYNIDIRYFSYVDNSHITHTADYSSIGGSSSDTSSTTAILYSKQYQTGDYLEKQFKSDTHDRTPNYVGSANLGLTLIVNSTSGIKAGWTADGNGYDGTQYVVTVTSSTWLAMSDVPTGSPIVGLPITFSTSTYEVVLEDTTDLDAGWNIFGNGYNTTATIVSVKNTNTIIVNFLPTNPTIDNTMLFTSSTNNLTLNNRTDLNIGYTASGNGYDGTQYITALLSGNRVKMSAQPNYAPVYNGTISFTSTASQYTISPSSSANIGINYSSGDVGSNYASTVTVHAVLQDGLNSPVIGFIRNYVTVNNPPPPPPDYSENYSGHGGGGNGGNNGGGAPTGTWGGVTGAGGAPIGNNTGVNSLTGPANGGVGP